MTDQEFKELLADVIAAYKEAGREVKTVQLIHGDRDELLVDNRTETDIN
jgi:predicted metallo-beta-lactamase superfamily hydrolase